ncbi:MAG: hypothetical protein R2940_10770 [Syntrophotaleaceae bacterium]
MKAAVGNRPGLVVALPQEAKALAGRRWQMEDGRPVCRSTTKGRRELLWVQSGVGAKRALEAARWLIRQKVTSLAVLGVSGGLAPGLNCGQLIVADTVLNELGSAVATCTGTGELLKSLRGLGLVPVTGPVMTVSEPVLDTEEKRRLHETTGALAVDMESAAVARVAADAGLNCLVLRAVCDGPCRRVHPALFRMLNEEGRLKIPVLVKELLRNPGLVFDLLTARRDFAMALTALKRAKDILGRG